MQGIGLGPRVNRERKQGAKRAQNPSVGGDRFGEKPVREKAAPILVERISFAPAPLSSHAWPSGSASNASWFRRL